MTPASPAPFAPRTDVVVGGMRVGHEFNVNRTIRGGERFIYSARVDLIREH
jgi:hypothetical protein